jgi:AcrR family transcriptional regulator
MVRPSQHSREEFLDAALAIVDSEGLEALTLRRLGNEVGVSYTAVYTYFTSREELIGTLVNNLSAEIVSGVIATGTTPREVILAIGISTRETLSRHPLLVPAFTQAGTDETEGETSTISMIVPLLEIAGLTEKNLALAYRAYECPNTTMTTLTQPLTKEWLAIQQVVIARAISLFDSKILA